MAQKIQDFYTSVQANDFARKFQFRLGPGFANTNLTESQLVYVESASLPGRAITNVPVNFMGLQFNVPGTATYPNSNNYAVRFRCDANYNIRAALEAAMQITFDDSSSSGNYNISRISSVVDLNLLNKNGDTIRRYQLIGAYVASIGDMAFDLADGGTIQYVDAVLAYQYWRVAGTSQAPNVPR
jgi:hypothetical protein